MAIDLSSDRVRLAESLLDGIRQGQQLGALLGYRFERALHDRQLDRFIPGFRRVSWLAGVYGAQEQMREAELIDIPRERIRAIQIAQRAIAAALRAVRERYELPPTAGVAEIEALAAAKVADGMALRALIPGRRHPLRPARRAPRQRADERSSRSWRRSSRRSTRSATR